MKTLIALLAVVLMGCSHSTGYFSVQNEGNPSKLLSISHVVMLELVDDNLLRVHMSNGAIVTIVSLTKDYRDAMYRDIQKVLEERGKECR